MQGVEGEDAARDVEPAYEAPGAGAALEGQVLGEGAVEQGVERRDDPDVLSLGGAPCGCCRAPPPASVAPVVGR